MINQPSVANVFGNHVQVDGIQLGYNTMTNVPLASTAQPSITAGTGAPTFAATQGSMYIRTDGGAGARLYMNSTGASTWIVAGSAA